MTIHRLLVWALPTGVLLFGAVSLAAPQSIQSNGKLLSLVWSDEFDYRGKPDPTKWGYNTGGGGWGNGDLENYTDRKKNARVENGHLIIEARKENYQDSSYTSARLVSKGDGWMYGHYEIKAKLPSGAGTWPAIWMIASQPKYGDDGWPDNGEIDIMENVGRDPNTILGSFYSANYIWYLNTGKTESISLPDAESDFHVYALDWDENEISLSVDGVDYNVFANPHTDWQDWPFDQNFGFIINLAIGGFGGDVDASPFPRRMVIDYVRIYQATTCQPPAVAELTP